MIMKIVRLGMIYRNLGIILFKVLNWDRRDLYFYTLWDLYLSSIEDSCTEDLIQKKITILSCVEFKNYNIGLDWTIQKMTEKIIKVQIANIV